MLRSAVSKVMWVRSAIVFYAVILAAAVALVVVAVLSADTKPAEAAFPGTNGKIAFTSFRTGNLEIWRVNLDGSGQINLSSSRLHSDQRAAYSATGRKIAFDTDRDGLSNGNEIYTMSATGLLQTRLTKNSTFDCCPAYSPDGTKIAFSRSTPETGQDIFVMNADGTGARRLVSNLASDSGPTWSPNGNKIAYESNLGGDAEIWVMNSDGTNEIQLTNNSVIDREPDWSPDNQKIVFMSNRGGDLQNVDIYSMRPARESSTNQPVNLTNTAGQLHNGAPAYSPDGKKIAFHSNRDGDAEIFVMDADGTDLDQLTTNTDKADVEPTWGPLP